MNDRTDPAYRFDAATGQLFFDHAGDTQVIGDIDLAMAWTTDEDIGGCLHKHGRADLVRQKAEPIRAIDPSLQVAVIPWEAIRHPDAGPRLLEDINACLAISGRVRDFDTRIAAIAADYDIEIFPRQASYADSDAGMTP